MSPIRHPRCSSLEADDDAIVRRFARLAAPSARPLGTSNRQEPQAEPRTLAPILAIVADLTINTFEIHRSRAP